MEKRPLDRAWGMRTVEFTFEIFICCRLMYWLLVIFYN